MEAGELFVSLLGRRSRTRFPSLRSWVDARTRTTPGQLVLLSILLVAGAVAFGVIATVAERSRAQAADAVSRQTEPLLTQAVTLYTALSDANAAVTSTFLQGGLEPPSRRAHYLRDLRIASDSLTRLTREVGSSPQARRAVATITSQLPVYSGLVEAARANNRQGLPVGAAYLRQASALLSGSILAEADRLYAIEANRLRGNYDTGTGSAALITLIVVALLALGALALAQRYLTVVSRRIFNVPMLVATAVLAAASIWAVAGLISEQNALAAARRNSDSVELLSASRVLLSRAQSDQSLTLANRGSDETDPLDFAAVIHALAPPRGLLAEVSALASRTGTAAASQRSLAQFAAYRAEAAQVADLVKAGRIRDAIDLASSPAASAVAGRADAGLVTQSETAQARFVANAGDATSSLSGLWIALPVLTVLAVGLALIGVRQRLQEYR